ncbi:MAG TPA: VWA domain-containing protein [Vicinamibacterales bacterium]|nr:VWA domain-containing protein [Vicinamibacterales bacterium]
MRPIALALTICGLTVLALSAVEGQPTFRSGVELVTIDVVATDRSGRPVHNLKASDFELFEDGKSQPIRTFEFIDASVAPAEAMTPPGIVTNELEPGGIFALVLDDIGYYVNDIQDVRRAAERFLNGALQPHDFVAVVRSGGDSGFTLTSDRARALDTIASAGGRRDRGIRLERAGAPDALGAGDFDTASPGETGKESFRVLEAVVEKLRPIAARRKAVVWFSRGGEMPASWETSLEIGQPLGRNEDALRSLINRARVANVAIYTVDSRGLVAPGTSGRDNPGAPDFEDVGTHRDLANATGGRAIVAGNDVDGALQRMSVENRAYYLIGYEPAAAGSDKKPRARRLKVTTRQPGVELLHRSLYLPGANTGAVPELLASPLPVRDLPIVLAPAAVAIDRNKRGIILPFEIGRDLRDDTAVEYTAIALDATGKVVSRAAGKGRARGGRLVGELGLQTQADTYQIRFGARALSPDVDGLAFATVDVPAGKSKEPACAGFVFEQPGARARLREFVRDQPITISTLVSAEKLDGAISIGLGAAGGVPQRLWPVTLDRPLANGLWRVALSLKAPLPAGELEVRVMRDDLLLADSCLTQFVTR